MTASLKDLIAALPQEPGDAVPGEAENIHEQIQRIFAELAHRPVPIGSLHRLWTMGELSTQVALAYLSFWVRQWFVDADRKRQKLVETHLRVVLKLIHRLGYLRGAASKVGQMLGSLPEIVPDQVIETLDRLHFDAPPMHFSLLRELVRNELGHDPEEFFAEFDRQPLAAASLGQVHRARLKSGEDVVIKIQYPGIARTIDADLKSIGVALFPARLGKDWAYTKMQFEEIRRMLEMEVNYEQEAENMRAVRELFRPEDGIVVPRVYDTHSTRRVLTMEYLSGLHVPQFLAKRPAQAARNAFATKIYVAWTRMYNARMNYADPHSGNYLFMSDGRLGLLDFGCIQRYDAEEFEILMSAERLVDGWQHLPEMARRCGFPEKKLKDKAFMDLVRESCSWVLSPVQVDGPFDFSDETHFKRGVEIFTRMALKRYTPAHPLFVYWNRSIIGIRALMYQLRAQVDVRAVFNRERGWPDPKFDTA